jgi:hypothetical protein
VINDFVRPYRTRSLDVAQAALAAMSVAGDPAELEVFVARMHLRPEPFTPTPRLPGGHEPAIDWLNIYLFADHMCPVHP